MNPNEDNKKLGKSLNEMLADSSLSKRIELLQTDANSTKVYIPLTKIVPNPFQPRKSFNEDKLAELASSIKERGVITPILVRKIDDKYEIVAGERRYRASIKVGLKEIPAIIEVFDDRQMSEIALIENIQREDLSAIEEAQAYVNIQNHYHYTQATLAKKVGKSRSYIANVVRLLSLPQEVKEMLFKNELSVGHVRALVGLEEKKAVFLAKEIKKENLNVREVERMVKKAKVNKVSPYIRLEKELSDIFGLPVKITSKELKIQYKDRKQLDSIIEKLKKD